MTDCSSSLLLLVTRSWSPWIRTWTLGATWRIRFCSVRARSSSIPALSRTSICPRPRPTAFGSPARNSFPDSPRRAAFSFNTCRSARARSSVDASSTSTPARCSIVGSVPLKSKRVPTSRRVWSSALISSAWSYSETTSNEKSGNSVEDRADPGHNGRHAEDEQEQRATSQQHRYPDRSFVDGLKRRPEPAQPDRGSVVKVVEAVGARPLLQLREDLLASGRDRLPLKVRERLAQVVSRVTELDHDHIERPRRGFVGMFAAKVGDDVVEGHSG